MSGAALYQFSRAALVITSITSGYRLHVVVDLDMDVGGDGEVLAVAGAAAMREVRWRPGSRCTGPPEMARVDGSTFAALPGGIALYRRCPLCEE